MATVNDCFLLFFYNTQTHRATLAQSTRPHKQALQTCTLTLFSAKKIFLNNCFETSH